MFVVDDGGFVGGGGVSQLSFRGLLGEASKTWCFCVNPGSGGRVGNVKSADGLLFRRFNLCFFPPVWPAGCFAANAHARY